MKALTALNLERNVIQRLEDEVFTEVNSTLSSLSLLNNLLTNYPTKAITSLKDLRVSKQDGCHHPAAFTTAPPLNLILFSVSVYFQTKIEED